jgi:2-keto-4-pentenoate hydratase/2-oxohepta-3-ene-1,7-dioic acid hydratase in catechol pathway
MKLLRHGPPGGERPGLLDSRGRARDLSAVVPDLDAATLAPAALERLRQLDVETLPLVPGSVRIGPCVAHCGKFVCIGLNYANHAKESSAIIGPNDDIVIPPGATKVDWEVELGVVIGQRLAYASEAKARAGIAGYCLVNDLSERAFQLEGTGQWVKGKSADTFGPIGPWLVTADEIPDPQRLGLWLDVNNERMQSGNTSDMAVGAVALVSYVSRFMSLQPGDIISTGTPAGVGMGRNPPRFLRAGDRVTLGIDGLGSQSQRVRGSES